MESEEAAAPASSVQGPLTPQDLYRGFSRMLRDLWGGKPSGDEVREDLLPKSVFIPFMLLLIVVPGALLSLAYSLGHYRGKIKGEDEFKSTFAPGQLAAARGTAFSERFSERYILFPRDS